MNSRPFVIAHRGASFAANENAASALLLAREQRAPAIEIDVRRAKDGAIVLHHDEDLARACGDPRRVADLTLAELKRLRQRFSPEREAEPILTLDEAHALVAPLPLIIEIKGPDADLAGFARSVAELVETRGDRESCIISFERAAIDSAATRIDPGRVGLIRNSEYGDDGWRELVPQPGGIAVLSSRIATGERIAALRAAGKLVFCYALDDAASVRAFVAAGVSGVISNRPDVALAALEASHLI